MGKDRKCKHNQCWQCASTLNGPGSGVTSKAVAGQCMVSYYIRETQNVFIGCDRNILRTGSSITEGEGNFPLETW